MNPVTVKLELDFAAQSLMQAICLRNVEIEEQVKQGLQNAIDSMDIVKEVEDVVKETIKREIRDMIYSSKLTDAIRNKIETTVEDLITKQLKTEVNSEITLPSL